MEARIHTSALEESAIIERVARIVFSVRGTKPDYTRLAAELEPAVPFDVFGVVLLRHDRQAVRITACERGADGWVARPHQHPLIDSMLECVLQRPALQVRDYPDGLDGSPACSGDALNSYHQLRSTLIAPLIVENRVLGTLELGSTALHMYADLNLQRLVDAVVRVLAAAIESVQLNGNAAIQDRQRQALKDVTSALTSKMDLSTVLERIVSGVAKALNVASFILLFDRQEHVLRLETQSGLVLAKLESALQQSQQQSEQNIFMQAFKRRQPLVSSDIGKDEHYPASQLLALELGLHSLYCYPLATGSTAYGVLVLCSPEMGGFTPLKTDILALFANQATVAIHNSMLLTSVQQRRTFQQAIEQFDLAQQRKQQAPLEEQEREELALLRNLRAETQQTFGVSFGSLIEWIQGHLLTQNERDLQTTRYALQRQAVANPYNATFEVEPLILPSLLFEDQSLQSQHPFAETQTFLTQSAESALARVAMLDELVQLKQSTSWVKDAWFVVDLSGSCLYMNPRARRLCDLNLEELSPDYYTHILVPPVPSAQEMGPPIEAVFAKLMPRMRNAREVQIYLQEFTQDSLYHPELCCVLAEEPLATQRYSYSPYQGWEGTPGYSDGAASDHHYRFTRYPLYTHSGQLEAIALQMQDVTEQVRDEKNRSALLSAFSHDLRTPLTTIKAAVTGLLQTDLPWNEEDRTDMLEDIDSEADHLNVLVNALIELSRIEMGAMDLKQEWCDSVEIFYGVVPKLKRALAHRQLLPQLVSPLPLVYVDHARLGQVFINLIENATRHSPDFTDIHIIVDCVVEDVEMLRVQVIDHGTQISEHECEHIFTSFQPQQSYGNGLALATCKGIIEAHQGHIWAEAADGGGSRFVFVLPIHPHTVVRMEEKLQAQPDEGNARSHAQG